MLRGFTYIKTGTEYKITQQVSTTNNHLSHQHVKWVVLIACLIFLLTQKSGITNDGAALLCRWSFEPKSWVVLFILHFSNKEKSSLAFSLSIGLTFFIIKILNNWSYPSSPYDQHKFSKCSCKVLRDGGTTLGSSVSGYFLMCLPQKEI